MKNAIQPQMPPRCRPALGTRIHHWFWTIVILTLWPAAILMRGLEKLRRHV